MSSKKTSTILICLFLLPWGIQYIVSNFMSVYIKALPFADEETVGWTIGIGSIITVIFQIIWTGFADKSKNKSAVLAISSFLLAVFSFLFVFIKVTNFTILIGLTILFYSCYMVHQPLIDTIGAETCTKTKHPFGWFRSFASFGYGFVGLLLIVVPINDNRLFFVYSGILAAATGVLALFIKENNNIVYENTAKIGIAEIFNPNFIKYLIYTFFLFASSSAISTFFPLLFTEKNGIGGDLKFYTFLLGTGAFLEWGFIILLSKKLVTIKPNLSFLLITLAEMFRSLAIYIAKDQYTVSVSLIFSALYFGILWSVATPYLKNIVDQSKLTTAQGMWTVIAFGIAPFVGSSLGGEVITLFGLRNIFLFISIYLLVLGVLAFAFLIDKKPLE